MTIYNSAILAYLNRVTPRDFGMGGGQGSDGGGLARNSRQNSEVFQISEKYV